MTFSSFYDKIIKMKMMDIHTTILANFLTDTLNKEKYLLNNLYEFLKTLKNHKGKNESMCQLPMSKIMCMPIKVGICTYATYANC